MHRAVRWLQLGGRQRQLALSIAFGSSIALATGVATLRNPTQADGGQEAQTWKSKSVVVSHDVAPMDRRAMAAKSRERKSDSLQRTSTTQISSPRSISSPFGDVDNELTEDESLTAWQAATDRLAGVYGTFSDVTFKDMKEQVTGLLIPSWLQMLPGWFSKLQNELSMAPWSLSWEIWEEAHNPEINPEILWDARVRISKDLCLEEQAFLSQRRKRTARALARYLQVPESDIHPDDVPVIGMCGSGGGLRALVAGTASFLSAAEDGLFDCVTYSAGVSGSCWLQTLYYSSVGRQDHAHMIEHLKQRVGVHIAYPPALFDLLSQAPTNKYLLSGYVEKLKGVPDADFGLVDFYGLALAARLLIPRNELRINDYDIKISNQRFYTDNGSQPLPLYTAVRHEIPDVATPAEVVKEAQKGRDYFQWFEWSPYEFFCEEIDAGIPTWAVGRKWEAGLGQWRENGFALPELRVPLMMGIWGSAFCATLSQYHKEIQPLLVAGGLSVLDGLLAGKNEDFVKIHPIDPAVIPNFALGLRDSLPSVCPESIHKSSHLQLMDAGIANNLPIYPLLRPGRNVDVVIAFDASADVRGDNWIKVVDGYAKQRGIKGWPMGAGWPPRSNPVEEVKSELDEAQTNAMESAATTSKYISREEADLGFCTVWAGAVEETDEQLDSPRPCRVGSEDDHHLLRSANAGIAVVYFPFVANEKVAGVDPTKDEFMSTWNFVYTPEQIDKVVSLARANYDEGREQTRQTIRAIWERKKASRLQKHKEEQDAIRRLGIRRGTAAMYRNGDVGHGDHFS